MPRSRFTREEDNRQGKQRHHLIMVVWMFLCTSSSLSHEVRHLSAPFDMHEIIGRDNFKKNLSARSSIFWTRLME